jgi:hypothetical protein
VADSKVQPPEIGLEDTLPVVRTDAGTPEGDVEPAPRVIGPYRLIELIGEGGMGERRVLGPSDPQTAMSEYNLAGLAALDGRVDEGFRLLRDALDHNLPPYIAREMDKDPDLRGLRGDKRFDTLVAEVRQGKGK